MRISSAKTVRGNNNYKNEELTFKEFAERFTEDNVKHTAETVEEYHNVFTKLQQASAKDAAGAFIGGWLEHDKPVSNVHRNKENVIYRTLLNLDFDHIESTDALFTIIEDLQKASYCNIIYTTHSHTPASPRMRVLIPLDRNVNEIEFEALTRHLVGLNDTWKQAIDIKSFEYQQAMYYPTVCKDGQYYNATHDGDPLDVDGTLSKIDQSIDNWHTFPRVPAEQKTVKDHINTGKQLPDPTAKGGYIGAFNKLYNIHDVIERYLSDVYEATSQPDRYTYINGTSDAGAIVYDNGGYLYSNHESDPAGNQALNSFDLVRIHKFYDENAEISRNKMLEHVKGLQEVKKMVAPLDIIVNEAVETPNIAEFEAKRITDDINTGKYTEGLTDIKKDVLKHIDLETQAKLYRKMSASYDVENFLDTLEAFKDPIPTGYDVLDRVLDGGLHDGLYIVGAISSLGKTTFTLQLADQIAKAGTDVLFFSLEMHATEIKAKSISRLTHEITDIDRKANYYAKSVRDITDYRTRKNGYMTLEGIPKKPFNDYEQELVHRAIRKYAEESQNLYIFDGQGKIGAEEITERVKDHVKFTGKVPVVIIDYLQILKPSDPKQTDKQNTDDAVFRLKDLSRKYKTPIFAISSFNRDNYSKGVSMGSFKESGAIEYSSDVLIGLQFTKQREVDAENSARAGNQKILVVNQDTEKAKIPREIELKILKNRNGATGVSIDYDYHAQYNRFIEKHLVGNEIHLTIARSKRQNEDKGNYIDG